MGKRSTARGPQSEPRERPSGRPLWAERGRRLLSQPNAGLAARVVIGLVFLASALAKLVYTEAFVQAVQAYEVLPATLVRPVALTFPWLELLIGACLLAGLYTRPAALAAAALMVLFMGLMGLALLQGKQIDCGCFVGFISETVGPSALIRDAVLLLLTPFAFFAPPHRLSLDARLPARKGSEGRRLLVRGSFMVGVLAVGLLPGALGVASSPQVSADAARPDGGWRLGPVGAKVQIVEYSDFQCPACRTFGPVLKRLVADYPGQVALVYRHFPLPNHQYARPAAEATEAAGEQGKFWEMHDAIFANQDRLSPAIFRQLAAQIGLDLSSYDAALASGRPKAALEADMAAAKRVGVSYTPYILVGGEQFSGRSFDDLRVMVEGKLQGSSR